MIGQDLDRIDWINRIDRIDGTGIDRENRMDGIDRIG